uniref:Uncharacterized protein n=1 Tax=Anguilla anguilla TaxID=7936 RepID=A0A0E9QZT3_ANGAN
MKPAVKYPISKAEVELKTNYCRPTSHLEKKSRFVSRPLSVFSVRTIVDKNNNNNPVVYLLFNPFNNLLPSKGP